MKKSFLLHIRLSLAVVGFTAFAIVLPTVVNAQRDTICTVNWWAICCKCKTKCLVVKPYPAFGYCRHCNLLCPDCNKELGNLNDALEKLKGKNRGLKEAYDAHEKSYADANEKYNATREKIYGDESGGLTLSGLNGSLGKFFGSGFAVLGSATGATKTMKVVANGISIYQTSGATDAAMNWSGASIDYFTSSENAKMIVQGENVQYAVNKLFVETNKGIPIDQALNNFNRNCDLMPNTPWTLDNTMKGLDFLGFAMDVIGYYTATKDLFGDISNIQDYLYDINTAKKEMDRITDSIIKNVDLMICIRETLDSLNSGGLGRSGSTRSFNFYAVKMIIPAIVPLLSTKYFAGSGETFQPGFSRYDTSWQINELKLAAAATELKQLQGLLKTIMTGIEKDILPPLIPWITNRWKELKHPVLLQMLRRSKKNLDLLMRNLDRARGLAESISSNITTAPTGYEINYLAENVTNPVIISADKSKTGNTPGGTDKWTVSVNEKIKGELGRVNMSFPAGVDWSIDFYTPENKFVTNRSSFSKHQPFYDITPGNYNIKLNHVLIENVSVEKGKEVRLKFGFVSLVTRNPWELYNESKEKFYTSGIKPVKFALPTGNYLLKFEGRDHRITIKENVTVKFEKPVTNLFD